MKQVIITLFALISVSVMASPDQLAQDIQDELNQNSRIEFYFGGPVLMKKYQAALMRNGVEHEVLRSGAIRYKRIDEAAVKEVLDPITKCHFENGNSNACDSMSAF